MNVPAHIPRHQRAEFRRMVDAIERGARPGCILGDRWLLQQALDYTQWMTDVDDDLPRHEDWHDHV